MKKKNKEEYMSFDYANTLWRYDPESGIIYWKNIHSRVSHKISPSGEAGTKDSSGRGYIIHKKARYLSYRIAWLLFYGRWPDKNIDHINGDPSDNRIINLRNVSLSDNMQNMKGHRQGRWIGARYCPHTSKSKPWTAVAPLKYLNRTSKKQKFIGTFKTEQQAGIAVIDYCLNHTN